MTKKRLIILFILMSNLLQAQKYNRPTPNTVFPFEFVSNQTLNSGYFLTAPLKLDMKSTHPNFISTKPIILDKNGFVFWYMNIDAANTGDFKYLSKDSLFTFIKTNNGLASYQLMDLHFNLVDSFANVNNVKSDGHELQKLSNGNFMVGGTKDSVMDLSAFLFNGQPGSKKTNVRGYVLQEFNKQHQLVFQWNSNDHIHPKESYEFYGYDSTKYDYGHGNSIEEDVDGNLVISLRYLNAVYKIDHKTGKVIWKLGGKSSSFKFVNDDGFSGQHDVRVLPNKTISLFDNANTGKEPRASRVVQYRLDTDKWTVTKTWEYNQQFFVKSLGSYHVSTKTKHLINYGFSFRPYPSISLVDENRKSVASIIFQDSVMSYRSFYFQIPFKVKQERIRVSHYGNRTVLMAPNGFKKYLWLTGETTQCIIVDKQQTYQVWMNYGEGMIGSLPLVLKQDGKNDFELYDQSLRKVAIPKLGETYLIKEKDGSNRKIVWY